MKRLGLAFCIAILCMASATRSFATTLTLSFSGTVAFVNDAGLVSGAAVGQSVDGFITMNVTPSLNTPTAVRYEGSASYELTGIGSGSGVFGVVENNLRPNSSGLLFTAPGNPIFDLQFSSSINAIPLFPSLSDIPDVPELLSLSDNAGGGYIFAPGGLHAPHFVVTFSIDGGHLVVGQTPIPPALPLFVSALGGLWFLGWRRKNWSATA